MPGGDGTGPGGMGPMTGRAAGYCTGFGAPGSMNIGSGRAYWGFAGGRGGRRGWRNRYYATGLTGWQRAGFGWPMWGNPWFQGSPYRAGTGPVMSDEQELSSLREQAGYLEETIAGIRQRIEEIEAKGKKE